VSVDNRGRDPPENPPENLIVIDDRGVHNKVMKKVYLVRGYKKNYKIGIAEDVSRRIAGLQTGNASKIELISFVETPHAAHLERELHRRLRSKRTTGGSEWFQLDDAAVIKICAQLHSYFPKTINRVGDDESLSIVALRIFSQSGYASISLLQRKLGIGYARAARIVDTLEALGYITEPRGGLKKRDIVLDHAS
jgi:DNA segregation ATPase FtsK/SpoIIIE-like protein